jgi:mannose/fructose/N-acetylgalactosamine-specific phosphotransferase system component IID
MTTLTAWDFTKIVFRLLFIQASWNYQRMLNLGCCFCLAPFATKFLDDSEASRRREFLKRHLEFFNTHPYMASWIIGATMKLEEQGVDIKEIEKVKAHLSRTLAAVGDQLFWRLLKPASAMTGLLLCVKFRSVGIGLLAFLVIYNLPHIYMRVHGLRAGYQNGFELVTTFPMKPYQAMMDFLNKLAALLSGIGLVGLGSSSYIAGRLELAAFLAGAILMYTLIKWKLPLPAALIFLIIFGGIIGALVGQL